MSAAESLINRLDDLRIASLRQENSHRQKALLYAQKMEVEKARGEAFEIAADMIRDLKKGKGAE